MNSVSEPSAISSATYSCSGGYLIDAGSTDPRLLPASNSSARGRRTLRKISSCVIGFWILGSSNHAKRQNNERETIVNHHGPSGIGNSAMRSHTHHGHFGTHPGCLGGVGITRSHVDFEQAGEGAVKDGDAVGVAQAGNREDAVDGSAVPQRGIVCSHDNLADADDGDEMAHVFGSK